MVGATRHDEVLADAARCLPSSLVGLVGEVAIQIVAVAALIPWQLVAGVGGVLLVGLDPGRAYLLRMGRNVADRVAS